MRKPSKPHEPSDPVLLFPTDGGSAMADPTSARRLEPGDTVSPHQLVAISGAPVNVPDPGQLVHLELRRFAGCPICNLHLRSVVLRKDELAAAGIKEVVVFHSTDEELRKYQAELPVAVIADPDKKLYAEFGVEKSPRAVLNPGAWPGVIRGLGRTLGAAVRGKEKLPPMAPKNGQPCSSRFVLRRACASRSGGSVGITCRNRPSSPHPWSRPANSGS